MGERGPRQAILEHLAERPAAQRTVRGAGGSAQPERGQSWFWLVAAEQDKTGAWLPRGGAGGSGQGPERAEPWVNLAGWWGLEGFYAGGEVKAAGAEVARVRLRCADEVELEDDADGGVVLFLTDRPAQTPVTVEICDSNGNILGSYSDF